MFEGVSVALVTPFSGGDLDEAALREVVRFVLAQGVAGVFPTGCTGEAGTLSDGERRRIWEICLEEAAGKAFVVAGTGTNATASTIARSREAAAVGVDGCMLISPYYNKPGQAGLLAHYRAVADAVDVPLVLYNVPGRTAVNIVPATLAALAEHPRIVAVKEASGSLDQATETMCLSDLTVLSGDDALTLPMAAAGARGVVSVVGHVAGRELAAMLDAHAAGRVQEAAALHRRLYPLMRSLFLESNPGPIKAALAGLGLVKNELRSPLVPVSAETEREISRRLEAAELTSTPV
jgi:4-hydroxy-tetrahydrodipicolinate synthase